MGKGGVLEIFLHDEVLQGEPAALDLLGAQHPVTAAFEKGTGGDGGVGGDGRDWIVPLELIAQRGGDTLMLVAVVDIEAVEIAGGIDIAKTDHRVAADGHQGIVAAKRTVPPRFIYLAGGPHGQLVGGVIGGADGVYGLIKQAGDLVDIGRLIGADVPGELLYMSAGRYCGRANI